jgi:Sec-independent protein translocase protein TatA
VPGIDLLVVLVVILAVVLVWRGPKVLPKWGETLGRGAKATKKELTELNDELRDGDTVGRDEDPRPGP